MNSNIDSATKTQTFIIWKSREKYIRALKKINCLINFDDQASHKVRV